MAARLNEQTKEERYMIPLLRKKSTRSISDF